MAVLSLNGPFLAGDNTLIAGVGGQSITIQEYDIQVGDGATLQWKDSSGVLLPGLLVLGVEVKYPGFVGYVLGIGRGLVLKLDTPAELFGSITYLQQ